MTSSDSDAIILAVIKISCMVIFFLMIAIVGNMPLRMKAFKSNQKLLSFSSAFAGGLFLAVGLLHLLPEAAQDFNDYFKEDPKEVFPYAYLIVIVSFSFILFIEKIITYSPGTESHHNQVVHEVLGSHDINQTLLKSDEKEENMIESQMNEEEEAWKSHTCPQYIVAQQAAKLSQEIDLDIQLNPWAPYILQIGIGIHAVFEGLSIGILTNVSLCFGVGVAVVCHKWAEGLTLGLAFKQAKTDLKMATYMIFIQAIMNPIGVGIGWVLSEAGKLVVGIFVSISVGTFIYIATVEVIVEEFSLPRYKFWKFFIYLFAITFVCSIWFIEQFIGAE